MSTDAKRLQQILQNLLSNAFKFTHKGDVNLVVRPASAGWSADNEDLNRASDVIEFSVTDTGIGIPTDKQQIIFEAFQQADGSTSRKYGGTGLGLAISRELSRLLRGEIRLVSAPQQGQRVLALPAAGVPAVARRRASRPTRPRSPPRRSRRRASPPSAGAEKAASFEDAERHQRDGAAPLPAMMVNEADDDRDSVHPGDRFVLIVENDLAFARVLLEAAREQGFKGIVDLARAPRRSRMVNEFKPSAILLDIFLPDIDGWRVLSRLKNDLATRHIPVHVISTEEARDRALDSGARRFIAKPIQSRKAVDEVLARCTSTRRASDRRLLLVEPDAARLATMRDYLSRPRDVEVDRARPTAPRAARAAARRRARLRDRESRDAGARPRRTLMERAARHGAVAPPPVIAYGRQHRGFGRRGERGALERIPGVREVHSLERLLDQVCWRCTSTCRT